MFNAKERKEVEKLKTRPSLKTMAPINFGSGDIIFYEYVHQCKRLADLEAEIIWQEYFYKYTSWNHITKINKKYHKQEFILGDNEGFAYPSEGLYFDCFFFCPYCGIDLTKDKEEKLNAS